MLQNVALDIEHMRLILLMLRYKTSPYPLGKNSD